MIEKYKRLGLERLIRNKYGNAPIQSSTLWMKVFYYWEINQ